jgi:hypothetical protein
LMLLQEFGQHVPLPRHDLFVTQSRRKMRDKDIYPGDRVFVEVEMMLSRIRIEYGLFYKKDAAIACEEVHQVLRTLINEIPS